MFIERVHDCVLMLSVVEIGYFTFNINEFLKGRYRFLSRCLYKNVVLK